MELRRRRCLTRDPQPSVVHEHIQPTGRNSHCSRLEFPSTLTDDDRQRRHLVQPGGQAFDETVGHVLYDENGRLEVARK